MTVWACFWLGFGIASGLSLCGVFIAVAIAYLALSRAEARLVSDLDGEAVQ